MRSRFLAGLALIGALSALPSVVYPRIGAFADTPACDGQQATIVGVPGERLEGTRGPDVIVTNSAVSIDAGDGDDLVCLTGRAPHDGTGQTNSGAGDDRVFNLTTEDWIVDLDLGSDEFYGGPGDEEVYTDGYTKEPVTVDVVRTGEGDDSVTSEFGGRRWIDDVDLGPGNDFAYGSLIGAGGRLVGGDGVDFIEFEGRLFAPELSGGAWEVTNTAEEGSATAAGRTRKRWAGFEQFWFDVFGPLSFTGSDLDEWVQVNRFAGADLGPGDDTLLVVGRLGGDIDGGSGDDRLVDTGCRGVLSVDLGRHRGACVRDEAPARTEVAGQVRVNGLEQLHLTARAVDLRGSSGPDRMTVLTCTGAMRGRGGDDTIINRRVRYVELPCEGDGPPVRLLGGAGADLLMGDEYDDLLRGGPGDDTLRGRRGRDTLVGGAGLDQAAGGPGRDGCTAETVVRCEQ